MVGATRDDGQDTGASTPHRGVEAGAAPAATGLLGEGELKPPGGSAGAAEAPAPAAD